MLENVRVTDKKAAQDDAAVQVAVKAVAEALGDTGRILVRESGTEPLVRVMDPLPFLAALEGRTVREERAYYAEYSKYLELSLVHDKTTHILIAILRDVTVEEEERLKKEEIGRQTVEIADRVVEKQMRIVQEIASLLGETTAETKIALTKLKESINSDEAR